MENVPRELDWLPHPKSTAKTALPSSQSPLGVKPPIDWLLAPRETVLAPTAFHRRPFAPTH